MDNDFDSRRCEGIRQMSAYLGGLMLVGKQICRHLDELAAASSVEDCTDRWSRIEPLGDEHADKLVTRITNDVKEMLPHA